MIDNLKLGLLLGILAPAITMLVIYLVQFTEYNFTELINVLISKRVFTKIVSLCAIPNLALFFLFLNKNYFRAARGVLLATVLFALFVFITKFTL
jgi:hypothetical protein